MSKDLNRYLCISNNIYKVEISMHANIQAHERGIDAELVDSTIHCGKIIRFAKNHLKFVGNKAICIDDIRGNTITIVTIVKK